MKVEPLLVIRAESFTQSETMPVRLPYRQMHTITLADLTVHHSVHRAEHSKALLWIADLTTSSAA
jgi:hypothetical protein